MPGDEHMRLTDNGAIADWRRVRALQEMGPRHTSADCHEVVTRLKAQAECLEALLADIRREIDEFECEEILDRLREQLFEADV